MTFRSPSTSLGSAAIIALLSLGPLASGCAADADATESSSSTDALRARDRRRVWNYSAPGLFGQIVRGEDARWTETNSTGTHAVFEETAVETDYIEITDFTRGFVWRLYDGHSTLKGPNFMGDFQSFFGGHFRHYRDRNDRRSRWSYTCQGGGCETGLFVTTAVPDRWEQVVAPNGRIPFVETDRTADYVELTDWSRGFQVRLYENRSTLRGPGFAGDFNTFFAGDWVGVPR